MVVLGRTFLQRIINLTRGVPSRFHHIRLNKEFYKDLNMWSLFLTGWNGRSFFLNTTVTPSPEIKLFTDTASTVGFGGYFKKKGNGSREGGRPTCFSTANGVLALSGKNYFPLWLPARSGILISGVNGYSFGATMSQSSPLSTLGILRSLRLWIYSGPLPLSPRSITFLLEHTMFLGSIMLLLMPFPVFRRPVFGKLLPRRTGTPATSCLR